MSRRLDHQLSSQLAEHVSVAQAAQYLLPEIKAVARVLIKAFVANRIVYTFGNGGSAADAQHLTGELIGHYRKDRRPLAAVTLSTDPTTLTCIANDYSYADVFSRQVEALVRSGDVVIGFSTSGNSANVVKALLAAQTKGAKTVLFGGGDGGPAAGSADHLLLVPSTVTPRIQEFHTFMLHALSEIVDDWAFTQGQLTT